MTIVSASMPYLQLRVDDHTLAGASGVHIGAATGTTRGLTLPSFAG
jgi:hypothetical protein